MHKNITFSLNLLKISRPKLATRIIRRNMITYQMYTLLSVTERTTTIHLVQHAVPDIWMHWSLSAIGRDRPAPNVMES